MSNINFEIKRYDGTKYDVLFPKTTVEQIVLGSDIGVEDKTLQDLLDLKISASTKNVSNGVAGLDANAKVPLAQLPQDLVNSLKYKGVIYDYDPDATLVESVPTLNVANFAVTRALNDSADDVGKFFIFGDSMDVVGFSTTAPNWSAVQQGYEDGGVTANAVSVEPGDWLIIQSINDTTKTIYYGIVNHTYDLADGTTPGIVTISNQTDTTGTSNKVITEGVLNGLIGTTANKLAAGNHAHASTYQGLNANLTDISGLSRDSDGVNKIVGKLQAGGFGFLSASAVRQTLDLEVGVDVQGYSANLADFAAIAPSTNMKSFLAATDYANARDLLGVEIGVDVQAYSGKLQDIANMAPTDGNIIVGNGSTWVKEAPSTARASLSVYSKAEVDEDLLTRPNIAYGATEPATKISGDLYLDTSLV